MAIEMIKNTGTYNETKVQTIDIQPLVTSKNHANGSAKISKEKRQDTKDNNEASKQGQASLNQIKAAISEANYKATRTRCEFAVDEPTKRISIKVIDKETDKVIREIPAEESLEMLAKIWELAGLLMDEKR